MTSLIITQVQEIENFDFSSNRIWEVFRVGEEWPSSQDVDAVLPNQLSHDKGIRTKESQQIKT